MMLSKIIFLFSAFAPLLFLGVSGYAETKDNGDNCTKLTGRVVLPSNSDYDTARLVSNYYTSKDKNPNAIVFCQNTQDVQNAVKWARCHKIPIRIRSGGHNHEGFSTGSGVIIIDVSEMKNLKVDKELGTATVQPGITGGELYQKLSEQGLTQVGGTCEEVGISGLALTGGMGPLTRRHGLTCDNLISLEMVNADGEVITVTKDNEFKDLFWACRGAGGGNFGIVTSLVLKVYPYDQVTWFNIGWDWTQPVEAVIATWQNLFSSGDKKWFSHLDLWPQSFSIEKFKKQPIKAFGIYYGSPDEAKRDLAPLLKIGKPNDQIFEFVKWNKAIKLFEESTSVYITDKPEYKSSGAFVNQLLPPDAIKIVSDALRNTKSPLLNILLFSLGGAAQDVAPKDSAYFYRDAKFFIVYSSQWLNANEDKTYIGEIDSIRERLLPYAQGNYIGNPDRSHKNYLKEYFGDNVQRLQCIKRKYDPKNVFNFEQSIPPAAENVKCD